MLDPISILAAISAANGAYSTLKTGVSNMSEAWSTASKFMEAKATVDLQAKEDEQSGTVSTEAFVRSLEYRRYEKEVDNIIRAFCSGQEIAQWNAHKEKLKQQAADKAEAAKVARDKARKIARRKQLERDENMRAAIIAMTIIGALGITTAAMLLISGVV